MKTTDWQQSHFAKTQGVEAVAPLIHNDTLAKQRKMGGIHHCEAFATIQTLSIILLFDHNYTNYGSSITSVFFKQGSEGNENLEA